MLKRDIALDCATYDFLLLREIDLTRKRACEWSNRRIMRSTNETMDASEQTIESLRTFATALAQGLPETFHDPGFRFPYRQSRHS